MLAPTSGSAQHCQTRAGRPLAIVSREATGLWEDAELRMIRAAEELLPAVAAILVPEQL